MEVAKRMECGQLAAAFGRPRPLESGSKLTALHTLRDFGGCWPLPERARVKAASVILLERLDAVAGFAKGGDAEGGGFGAAQGGHDGRAGIDGGGADFDLVGARGLRRRGC